MSREAILGRVRAALSADRSAESSPLLSYPRTGTLNTEERLQMLEERLHEYDARVFHCPEQALAQRIFEVLSAAGRLRIIHPAALPTSWHAAQLDWTPDSPGLSYAEIEAFDGVLTGATAAVTESGSIVLQHGPAEGRRALTLLPDYHLCVIFENQIVETLPECFDRLKANAAAPTTFISGPSATADIEMTRIKGVHGPRFLDVILVTRPSNFPKLTFQ
ncbi:MAG: lactate utilization protein C [Silvibacterium sp.]|nr:lactate utilization protein C [Silvibacterium sp.]